MKIFISWSGDRSRYIAETLSDWLQQVLQMTEPWTSTDIDKGRVWNKEIATQLSESKVAIICLTKDNLKSKWIHFEAGAIAKTEDASVCTFLFDITPANVEQPLSQFQATKNEKTDILQLVKSINIRIGETGGKSLSDQNLESVFKTFWPQLKEKLDKTPKSEQGYKEQRTERELLEESLELLRNIALKINKENLEKDLILSVGSRMNFYSHWNKRVQDLIIKYSDEFKDKTRARFIQFLCNKCNIDYMSIVEQNTLKNIIFERLSQFYEDKAKE